MNNFALAKALMVSLAAVAISAISPATAVEPSFIARYSAAKSRDFELISRELKRRRFLENLAVGLSQGITLPRPITLTIAECGRANAFYDPRQQLVVLCHELMQESARGIRRDFGSKANSEQIERAVSGLVTFVLMHELGHALIDVLGLPVLGRQEDAADQIGTFFLLQKRSASDELAGALWFFRSKSLFYSKQHFGNEHSLDPQRQINLACWAYGKDPGSYRYLVVNGLIPQQRAVRCQREYQQLDAAVRKLLGAYVRL